MTPRNALLRTGAAALTAALIATPAIMATTATAQALHPRQAVDVNALRVIRVEAYVGPRAYLGGAKVTVRDRTGHVIGGAVTRYTGGTAQVNMRSGMRVKLPLTITTSGGKITTINGGGKGDRFKGSLTARAFTASPLRGSVVQLSVISTAASEMATTAKGYAKATAKARAAMGFTKRQLVDVLSARNEAVGYSQLMRAVSRQGGFAAFSHHLATQARAGKRVSGLRPASATKSAMPMPRGVRSSNQASTSAMCSVKLPNSSGISSNSTVLIEDIGSVGVADLIQAAGAPTEAALGITGMLLAGVGDAGPSSSSANSVSANLACLKDLLNYVSDEVDLTELSADLTDAKACATYVTGQQEYSAYVTLTNNMTQQTGEAAPSPTQGMTSQNTTFTGVDIPAWGLVAGTCLGGAAINTDLFANGNGYLAAWSKEYSLVAGTASWMTQTQAQALQNFLSYWGGAQYQQYVLQAEYDNWMGYTQDLSQISGGTVNADGSLSCAASTGTMPDTGTQTFCNYQNNINAVTPPDLYSDEVGIISSGIAVNAIPGGLVAPPAISSTPSKTAQAYNSSERNTSSSGKASYSPTALNPAWAFNYYLNWTPNTTAGANQIRTYFSGSTSTQYTNEPAIQCTDNALKTYSYSCPLSGTASIYDFDTLSVSNFNAAGVNPKGYGSAVQTYNNPQYTQRVSALNADIEPIKSAGPNGMSGTQALYNGLNQTPNGGTAPLSGASPTVNSSQVLYMTPDNGYVTAQQGGQDTLTWEGAYGATKSGWENTTSDIPGTPIFAFFTKRSWWSTASSAATFYAPPSLG